MSRAALAVAVVVASIVPPPAAQADERPDRATARARAHFERGEALFALGRFREALAEYEAAFEAKPLPQFLFNVAQCHRNLGNLDDAIFTYRKYLKLAPNAPNRAAVEALIRDLERRRRRQRRLRDGRRLAEPATAPAPPARTARRTSRWWYVAGGVAVVALGLGAYAVARSDDGGGIPPSDLGNLDFPK
ncbi:MAG: tetratricopeptide repeat protein [Deltaproteobacteria bacterium]|nr:MAG: tetratricopeptide repeat protein [Deltaproteobacteria bacterium]